MVRHDERGLPLFSRDRDTFGNGGNDVAGPLDLDGVANADVFSRDLIGVVEGGPTDCHASHLHRFQQGQRCEGTGTSYRHRDVLNDRDFLPRRQTNRR